MSTHLEQLIIEQFADILLGERLPLDIFDEQTGEILVEANQIFTRTRIHRVVNSYPHIGIDPSPIRDKLFNVITECERGAEKVAAPSGRKTS